MVICCPQALPPIKKDTKDKENSNKSLWVEKDNGNVLKVILLPNRDIRSALPEFLTTILQIGHGLDYLRKMLMFQPVYFLRHRCRRIVRGYGYPFLEDHLAMVI